MMYINEVVANAHSCQCKELFNFLEMFIDGFSIHDTYVFWIHINNSDVSNIYTHTIIHVCMGGAASTSKKKGRDHQFADEGMQQKYRLEGSSIDPPTPPTSHQPLPPMPLLRWYDLLDYKTALPCVCLLSVPAERLQDQAPAVREGRRRRRKGGERKRHRDRGK